MDIYSFPAHLQKARDVWSLSGVNQSPLAFQQGIMATRIKLDLKRLAHALIRIKP